MNVKDRNPAKTTGLVELSTAELSEVAGGGPHVKIFNGSDTESIFAYTPTFTGGVRVAAGDIN